MRRRGFMAGVVAAGLAPVAAKAEGGLRIAVISDLNGSYGSTDYGSEVDGAIARIVEMGVDLVICTGDMIAGQRLQPKLKEPEIEAMWLAFHSHVTDPLRTAGIPLLVTPGNHDASAYPGFELERQLYDRTWTGHAPDVQIIDGERYPFRYAVSHGGVLLVGLDVTVSGPLPAEETDWTAQILREEAKRHQATLVFGHLPIWPITEGREADVVGDPAFEKLLVDEGADLYLSGHHHAYYPFRSGGLMQVSQACLGAGPRKYLGTGDKALKAFSLIDISPAGQVAEHSLAAPQFTTTISLASLPETLPTGRGHRLQRGSNP